MRWNGMWLGGFTICGWEERCFSATAKAEYHSSVLVSFIWALYKCGNAADMSAVKATS
jgi:hypothetical protein